eukprot:4086745-Amphidinium_carterae.1
MASPDTRNWRTLSVILMAEDQPVLNAKLPELVSTALRQGPCSGLHTRRESGWKHLNHEDADVILEIYHAASELLSEGLLFGLGQADEEAE